MEHSSLIRRGVYEDVQNINGRLDDNPQGWPRRSNFSGTVMTTLLLAMDLVILNFGGKQTAFDRRVTYEGAFGKSAIDLFIVPRSQAKRWREVGVKKTDPPVSENI